MRILMCFLLSGFMFSQNIMDIQKINVPITIDGIVNEAIWDQIEPLPLTMITPQFKGEKTEKSEIRICYDNNYLYFSGRFYDSQPDQIAANSLIRDKDRGGDFFNVLLDTFNDNENNLVFSTTPAGNRIDNELLNDAEGNFVDIVNYDWNAYWDAKTTQDETGWFVETRIPFTSLRYNLNGDEVIFGFITHRLISRKGERHTFPEIAPNKALSHLKPSNAAKIRLKGITNKRPLYITPYSLAETGNHTNGDINLGLDLKYGVSNNQNLDITLNTDFAQAEADEIQVNLTRFGLFYPEKRQFFQERAAVFKFQTSSISSNRLFHSRRIGLSENGELLDVYGGARFVGRSSGWDYGVLDMQTAGVDSVSNINHAVLRFRKQTFNNQSYLGGLFTSQINSEGNKEFVMATDALINLGSTHFLHTNIGYISGSNFETDFNEQSLLYLQYENRNETGWGYSFEAERVGMNMVPSLGFIRRPGTLALNQETLYGYFIEDSETWRKMTISLNHQSNYSNGNNELESLTNALETTFAMNTGGSVNFSVRRNYDKLTQPFKLTPNIIIPIEQYTFYSYGASYNMSETSNWRINPSVSFGDFYDGKQIQLMITPIWNQSRYLELSGTYIYNKIDFDSRGQTLRADLARLNILASFNSQIFLTSLIQYDQSSDQVAANVRLRFNFSEGHDLYVVFNGSKPTITTTSQLDQTKFIVKYSYTFTN